MTDADKNQEEINLDNPDFYVNRELSLLEFQRRVLEEAKDEKNPLLERVKFISIFGSNMEEFFMIRVGGLTMQKQAGVLEFSIDGKTPAEQLAEIRKVASDLMQNARSYFCQKIKPSLKDAGIHVLDYSQLSPKQKELADDYFHEVVFPVLTPLAFDPGHPFPHISNLSFNLAILVRGEEGDTHFARLKVPPTLPQLVPLKRSSGGVKKDGTVPRHHYFVWLHQLIIANLDNLFPGTKILEAHPFHITRNADLEIQELEALDLLETIEESILKRRFGDIVRLMVNANMPQYLKDILIENLEIDRNAIYTVNEPLNIVSLMELTRIDRYDLKFKPFTPVVPALFRRTEGSSDYNHFAIIGNENILLHHPYDSFMPVVEFLKTAAKDPNVLAIKQTLYRVGENSPVVNTLLKARREYGKQVAVLVELKARFDEKSNISWARKLEQEGVHVIYGLLGLKTHSKIALVVRKEGDHIRRYVHLGTGNYNHITAQLYEDLGMFTCDDDIGADATDLFNYLTGYSYKKDYRKLLVAPINLREKMDELILQEIENQKKYGNGHLIFKMNAIVDKPIIRLLYQASQAGVKVDLIVRSVCCLRPGLAGVSDNIQVRSILGRFLEHSRIYYFHNNGDEKIVIGSADLMPRNIDRRVEVLFPVEGKMMIRKIRDEILENYLKDNSKARIMFPDGHYELVQPLEGKEKFISQEFFLSKSKGLQ